MIIPKSLIASVVLLLSVPIVPALAHEDEDRGSGGHDQLHDQLSDSHERAHEDGFESGAEHRAYHRALRDFHDDAHERNAPRDYGYERPRYRDYYERPRYRTYRYYRDY